MLPLKLKKEPTFDIEKDLAQIHNKTDIDFEGTAENRIKSPMNKVTPLPHFRAYIQDKETDELIAVFDALEYHDVGALIKLALSHLPKNLDESLGFANIEVMNTLREVILDSDRFYRVALFQADEICFHFSISTDLVVFLCNRLHNKDIVARSFWSYLADHPGWENSFAGSNSDDICE